MKQERIGKFWSFIPDSLKEVDFYDEKLRLYSSICIFINLGLCLTVTIFFLLKAGDFLFWRFPVKTQVTLFKNKSKKLF